MIMYFLRAYGVAVLAAWAVTRLYLIKVFPVKSKKHYFGQEIIHSKNMSLAYTIIWTYLGTVSSTTHSMFIIIAYANHAVSTLVTAVQTFKTLVRNFIPITQVSHKV